MARKSVDPLGTIPMDIEVTEMPRAASELRKRYVKPNGYAKCPICTRIEHIGFVRIDGHYVWKEHNRVTQGRARFVCDASHKTLCQVPPAKDGANQPECCCTSATRKERLL